MEALDTPRYKLELTEASVLEKDASERHTRHLLKELLTSSSDLNMTVWIDGVYTNIEDPYPKDVWMDGREVYFKVEGRVSGIRELIPSPTGGT